MYRLLLSRIFRQHHAIVIHRQLRVWHDFTTVYLYVCVVCASAKFATRILINLTVVVVMDVTIAVDVTAIVDPICLFYL